MADTMTERELREEFARRVISEIVRNRSMILDVVDQDGRKPIVCALDHELLSEVMQRVDNAGGSANTFVLSEDRITRASFRNVESYSEVEPTHLGKDPIHQDITIGMFLTVVATYESGVTARIRLPRHSSDVADFEELALQR